MKLFRLPGGTEYLVKSQNRRWVLGLAGLAWLALAASFYYVTHKPFSPALAGALGRALAQTAVAFGLASVGGGLGHKLLPYLPLRPLAALALQAAAGLGLLSLAALAVGSTIGVSLLLAWGSLIILGIFLRRSMLGWWRSWRDLRSLWLESDGLGKALGCGVGALLLLAWMVAVGQPLKFDALVYHLALPRLYLDAGRVIYVPGNMFWGMPQLGELLYTWMGALAGLEAAVSLGWLAGGLAITGLLGLVWEKLGTRPAWVAAAAILSGYSLSVSLAWGYVDWWVVLFGVGCLAALSNFQDEASGSLSLPLAGLFAGLALGTKYSAGVLLLAGCTIVVRRSWKAGSRLVIGALLKFALPAVLISLPWWLKNTLATGNPFYPFFLPSGAMNSFRQGFYTIPVWGGWREAVLLPWRATMLGVEGGVGYSASLGPLLLGLAPLALFEWKGQAKGVRSLLGTAGWISLSGLVAWAVAGRLSGYLIQARLYWAIFPALAVLAGAGFKWLDGLSLPGVRLGRVAGALILALFTFSVLQVSEAVLKMDTMKALLALEGGDDYLDENLGWYAPAIRAVQDLPVGSRTLLLWEPRSLYCAPGCQPDEVLDRWLNDLRGRSPEEVLQAWRGQGYTHLLLNRIGADYVQQNDARYHPDEWQALGSLLASLSSPQDFGGAYQLYSLAP